MRHELPYFHIGSAYGGWQEWLPEYMMRLGGCAAVTACDCSIYFALYKERRGLYPYDAHHVTKADYIRFTDVMKPYLHPRWSGIDRLAIYIDGFGRFLRERGETALRLLPWEGERTLADTWESLRRQVDAGWTVPCLTLKHANPAFDDYVWHWFLLTGYEADGGRLLAKAVTYGSWRWLDFAALWDTGYERKGGLILFREGDAPSG